MASANHPPVNLTHYQLLGVRPGATESEIKGAYHFLSKKYHPDASRDPQTEEIFKTINNAYSILSDTIERGEYDKKLAEEGELHIDPVGSLPSGNQYQCIILLQLHACHANTVHFR